MIKATVILPTTKERGPVLPYSVGSVLGQSMKEIELFIIGDGVDEETRRVISELKDGDNRIQFFDYPKGQRRGESYRHEVLMNNAQGEIVCYLLDRDLYLPNHVAHSYQMLMEKGNTFSISRSLDIRQDGSICIKSRKTNGSFDHDLIRQNSIRGYFSFSPVAHTLESYNRLPYGWRTTPRNYRTDSYMWDQFLTYDKRIKLSTSDEVSLLYFKRGDHPGWSAARRAEELSNYYELITKKCEVERMINEAYSNLLVEHQKLLNQPLLIKGKSPIYLPKTILRKIRAFLGLNEWW